MRRYNINVKAVILTALIVLLVVILLIMVLRALIGNASDRGEKPGADVSASPTPLPTHSPRPQPTSENGLPVAEPPAKDPQTSEPPVSEPPASEPPAETAVPPAEPSAPPEVSATPAPDAKEVIASICMEPPKEHSEEESLARLQILATYDDRFQEVIDRLPELPELSAFELSVNPELLDFLLGWPGEGAEAEFSAAEASGETQLLMQYDPRWGYAPYGSGPVAFNGCGPTCLSMAVLHFTGNPDATPDKTAKWALDHNYYVSGSGTKWTLFSEGIREWGVGSRELPLWKGSILSALDKGNWVVMCMKEGNFTIYGHFIVVCGYSDEGFQVLDPFSRTRSSVLWKYEDIESQISNLWAVGITGDLMNPD